MKDSHSKENYTVIRGGMSQIKQLSMKTLKETFQNYCSFSTVLLDHPAAHSSGHSCCICLLLLYTGVPVIPLVWEFFWHIHSTYAFAILPQKYDYVNQVASAHRTGTDAVSPLHLLTASCVVSAPGL